MLTRKLNSLKLLHANHGMTGVLSFLWSRYISGTHPQARGRIDVFNIYDYLNFKQFGDQVSFDADDACVINWLILGLLVGSGGHINTLRLIYNLEQRGYKCRIILTGGFSDYSSTEEAKRKIRENFFPLDAEVSFGASSLKPAKITVATSWLTAYAARNFKGTQHRCYFVQDYEPHFYPHGSEYYFAEATYRMGFYGITAGNWLAHKLATEYGMQTTSMGFSYDRELYRPHTRLSFKIKQVFFYARPVTERRGFELGLLALNRVAQQLPDVEFILAGWDASTYYIPFKHKNAGSVAVKDLAKLYSQCDVALVLSMTNLSLLPLELMACGCPVVSNNGANVEWLLNDSNAVLADPTPEALGDAIISLLQDDDKRMQLAEDGLKFAATTSWDVETSKVADFFEQLMADEKVGEGL